MHRMSKTQRMIAQQEVGKLLAKGHVVPCCSPYASPVHFVKEKDGTDRLVIDSRAVNNITVKNKFPIIPRIDGFFDELRGAAVSSALDLRLWYHQLRTTEEKGPKLCSVYILVCVISEYSPLGSAMLMPPFSVL